MVGSVGTSGGAGWRSLESHPHGGYHGNNPEKMEFFFFKENNPLLVYGGLWLGTTSNYGDLINLPWLIVGA